MAYESKFKKEDIDELFEAVLTLRDLEDCYRFFEDICTINELHAIAQRLQVAKLLSEKKTYSEIEAITNASTATISRINKCLIYGADGYQRVLERLKEKEKAKVALMGERHVCIEIQDSAVRVLIQADSGRNLLTKMKG